MPTHGGPGQTAHAGSLAILFPARLVVLLPALGLCACSRMSSLPLKCYLLIDEEEVHPCILIYKSTCGDLTSFSCPPPSGTLSGHLSVPSTASLPTRYDFTQPFDFWLWFIHRSSGQTLYVISFPATVYSSHTCSYHLIDS